MLITRKSRRSSDLLRSRFRDGGGDFPLRQYMRCREELFSSVIHALLLAAFLVTLVYFGRTLWQLFAVHGAELSPWYRRVSMFGMAVVILFVTIRFWRKIGDIREVRQEMTHLKSQFPTARGSR